MLRFSIFATLTLAIMAGVMGYALWYQVREIRSMQNELINWTVDFLDTWMAETDNELAAAVQKPQLLQYTPDHMQEYLHEILVRNPSFRHVSLVDARPGSWGQELMTLSREDVVSVGRKLGQEVWFPRAWEKDRYVSPVVITPDVPVVTLAYAIYEQGVEVGVIAVELDLLWPYQFLSNRRIENEGYIYVLDNTGRPIMHKDASFIFADQNRMNHQAVRSAVLRGEMPEFYPGLNHNQDLVMGAYKRLERASWTVVAEQPLLALARKIQPLLYGTIGVLLAGGLVAIGVGGFILNRMARPIMQLREGTQRIAAEELSHRIELSGKNELADLAQDFNRMASTLEASRNLMQTWNLELEARVAERTDELSQSLQQRERLLQAIQEMSSPIIPVMEGIAVIPIVGMLDNQRAQHVVTDMLKAIEKRKLQVAILDITGLAVVDTATAKALVRAAHSAKLLGARVILVGITPQVAETLVHLGVSIDLRTAATLQEGLQFAGRLTNPHL